MVEHLHTLLRKFAEMQDDKLEAMKKDFESSQLPPEQSTRNSNGTQLINSNVSHVNDNDDDDVDDDDVYDAFFIDPPLSHPAPLITYVSDYRRKACIAAERTTSSSTEGWPDVGAGN